MQIVIRARNGRITQRRQRQLLRKGSWTIGIPVCNCCFVKVEGMLRKISQILESTLDNSKLAVKNEDKACNYIDGPDGRGQSGVLLTIN
jgi:hypothetical protein